jgi:glycosyltransferase involved in cell wall biosynthesis
MDIVINGRFLTQGITGVQRYARELIGALDTLLDAEPGMKVTVVSPRLSKTPPAWRNIELRQVGYLRGHAWEQIELPWYARGKILFCPGNTIPVISLLVSQPAIVTIHDLSYRYFPDAYHPAFRIWYGLIIPLALRYARDVITVSETERRAIIAHYPAAAPRLHAIPNGGISEHFAIEIAKSSERHDSYVLYVGSFSKRKNFPRTVEVACRLARERGLRFVFVGGTSKSLAAPAAKIPDDVSSHITLLDGVDDEATLISYYRNAACFLFPSLYESSGLPPIEAMACGCPVDVSDIPALKERCGDAALYCDPYDAASMAEAILQIVDNTELRAKLTALGYQRAANCSWEACARDTLALISQLQTKCRTADSSGTR